MIPTALSFPPDAARSGQSAQKFSAARFPTQIKRFLIAIVIAACWITSSLRANAVQSVTLTWDPGANASAVGYRVYAYEDDSNVATTFNVFGLTRVTLPGLREGQRYTFKVTSYNADGVESAPSNAAEFTVPVPLQMFSGDTPTALRRLQFPILPQRWYEVQWSTNMQTWTTFKLVAFPKNYTWTEIQEPPTGLNPGELLPGRFFRLRVH